jgi:hypothetical protein
VSEKPKRRRYQFSLKTMFVGTTLSAIAILIGLLIAAEERQRVAVRKVDALGGSVGLVDNFPGLPHFIMDSVPTSYFSVADGVELGCTSTTDDDLSGLRVLTQLKRLALNYTPVTDAGLVHLQGLAQLQDLDLSGTQVTDAGLLRLSGLKNLQLLTLADTRITDAGVKSFQELLPNVQIHRQRLSLSVDCIEFENKFLEQVGYTLPPEDGLIVLKDIDAFFIQELLDRNSPEMKFSSRPKVLYWDGKKAAISIPPPDRMANADLREKGAWFCRQSCAFQVTPKILSPQRIISLTFQFSPPDRREALSKVTVADEVTVLAFMNSPRSGVHRAVMITPRITEAEPAP